MSTEQDSTRDENHTPHLGLDPGTYTAQRLKHATPEHLHLTTRCCFIGPIPVGWLKSHRKHWYKHHLHINYSSRAATFSANGTVSRIRQLTGLDGPSTSAIYGHSFPQPDDADDEDDSRLGGEEGVEPEAPKDGREVPATTELPPAIPIPRSMDLDAGATRDHDKQASDEDGGLKTDPVGPIPPPKRETSKASKGDSSFHTASEFLGEAGPSENAPKAGKSSKQPGTPVSMQVDADRSGLKPVVEGDDRRSGSMHSENSAVAQGIVNSKSSLIPHGAEPGRGNSADFANDQPKAPTSNKNEKKSAQAIGDPASAIEIHFEHDGSASEQRNGPVSSGLVRFNIPDKVVERDSRSKARLAQLSRRRSLRQFRRGNRRDGEIVKMEKMLVKVESTVQELSEDYDENNSMLIDSNTVEKWQEFVVVCRESVSDEAEYVLQLYKSRVIPEKQEPNIRTPSKREIVLSPKTARVNLYSTLDKTVVLWVPWKRRTMIYILRPRSLANSVEWYTFLRNALGWDRPREVQVYVPDLSVTLYLENPFQELEAQRDAAQASSSFDEKLIMKTMQAEQAVAGNIIKRCMAMLKDNGEWAELLRKWSAAERMGLAWKRYDRLEWVHGINEQKMYGTVGMQRSHDLELRPKQHYPTTLKIEDAEISHKYGGGTRTGGLYNRLADGNGRVGSSSPPSMTEPSPVEGFLIRLTSQRGRDRRMGRMFYKRLYFSTHSQYLCFSRPAYAIPPPPPKLPMTEHSTIPSTRQITENMPLIYAIVPFRLADGEIAWLQSGNSSTRTAHDRDAFDEAERRVNTLLRADGYIDMCKVSRVRSVIRGSVSADRNIDQGGEVDFDENVPNARGDDGAVDNFDDGRTFELLLTNGLIVRLEAYDALTKREWIKRLKSLVTYWKLRKAADMELLKLVRRTNLERLRIDEESEPFVGQFAHKWEVSHSVASSELFNICGISCCRTISVCGPLYWKPRRRSTFTKCNVILCHSHLLHFQGSLRAKHGAETLAAHQERLSAIDLRDCYIYSGLITEGDLLYQNQTFDSLNPGRHALPRIYLEDGWKSSDDDFMTCFVIWRAIRKSYFKMQDEGLDGGKRQHLRQVTSLGVPGQSIVFKARSRAERDHWVMSIATEIERLQQPEEIRVVQASP